ncbi:MAG: 4-amino-4-deoxy-L-arabinose transferase or related glycosyltransferase of family [Candidatus Adlerbacteria bacterium]|nr:4-amino-4-deoxy-L-arabinose transferase or related glycosyltransferase of family [Candidatus Adlerbacteria bacterium]
MIRPMQKAGLFACGLVLAWAAWAMFAGLGTGPLQLYDEGTYAQVTGESLHRGDFLNFTLGGLPWLEKPPLYFWLAGAATYITGSEVLGIRLPAALFGIAVVAMTMVLAYSASRRYWVAALAGALLVSTEPFVQGAREARLDLVVVFFILLAYCAAFNKKYVWFGVAVGLAVLSKSVIAVFAAAALPLISMWTGDWSWLRDRRFWLGAGVGLIIVAPWHLWLWWEYSGEFWRQYVGYHVLDRYESNLFFSPEFQTDYLARLFDYAKPLLAAFFAALITVPLYVRQLAAHDRAGVGVALSLLGLMVLVFFTAQTRALSYLIPLYPFAALFISLSCFYVLRTVHNKGR